MEDLRMRRKLPVHFKIVKALLMIISAVTVLLYIIYAVNYVTSGPYMTLFDDLSTIFVVKSVFLALSLVFLLLAWAFNIFCGSISVFFIAGYALSNSIVEKAFIMDFMEIVILVIGVLFIILGLYKKWLFDDSREKILGPTIQEHDGPDITKFRL